MAILSASHDISPESATGFNLVAYESSLDADWDELVRSSSMGTFLHTRKFLSYHDERFEDLSLLVFSRKGLKAVFPAALALDDTRTVTSHPGSTYGGLVHDGTISGEGAITILRAIDKHYKNVLGLKQIKYKAVPWIYHTNPAQDDIYALFHLGAQCYRCDLSQALDLRHSKVTLRRRRARTALNRSGITLSTRKDLVPELWEIITTNLKRKHNKKPVHSLNEMLYLSDLFPSEIRFLTCSYAGQVVAGAVLFNTNSVCHVQYMAVSDAGKSIRALDMVIQTAIENATHDGQRYFDFGISTDHEGSYLNGGLETFKSEFGASGVTYNSYCL